MLGWNKNILPFIQSIRPGGGVILHRQKRIHAMEMQALVTGQCAGKKLGLSENLESVTNTQNRHALVRGVDNRTHHRG